MSVFSDRVEKAGGGTGFMADVQCSACGITRTVQIAENGWYGFDCCGRWHTGGIDWRQVAKHVEDAETAAKCLAYAERVDVVEAQRRESGDFF